MARLMAGAPSSTALQGRVQIFTFIRNSIGDVEAHIKDAGKQIWIKWYLLRLVRVSFEFPSVLPAKNIYAPYGLAML